MTEKTPDAPAENPPAIPVGRHSTDPEPSKENPPAVPASTPGSVPAKPYEEVKDGK